MDQEKRALRQEICVSVIIMAFAVTAFVLSLPMPGQAPIFPRMASAFLFLCGLGLLIGTLLRHKKGLPAETPAVEPSTMANPLIAFVIILIYALGFQYVGFYVTTFVVTTLLMLFMGIRSVKTWALVEGILLVFLYWLFTVQLSVPMPLTPLP